MSNKLEFQNPFWTSNRSAFKFFNGQYRRCFHYLLKVFWEKDIRSDFHTQPGHGNRKTPLLVGEHSQRKLFRGSIDTISFKET